MLLLVILVADSFFESTSSTSVSSFATSSLGFSIKFKIESNREDFLFSIIKFKDTPYLPDTCIKYVYNLLKNPNMSLLDVAVSVGFNSHNYYYLF